MSEEHRPDGEAQGPDQPEMPVGDGGAAPPADLGVELTEAPDAAAADAAQPRRWLPRSLLGRLAITAILAAAGAATFFWWQYRELEQSAAEADVAAAALDTLRADVERAEARAAGLASELTAALDAERRARE